LAKIRAQLRASVFLALEEQETTKKKAPLQNEKAKQFGETETGRLCAEVVADLLESLNLDATLSVFTSEFHLANRRSRSALATALDLPSNLTNESRPLLAAVLESDRRGSGKTDKDLTPTATKPPPAQTTSKAKKESEDNFINGAKFFGGGKTFDDDISEDEDFFDSAGRANAKKSVTEKSPTVPSTVTMREKNISLDGKQEPPTTTKKRRSEKRIVIAQLSR